VRATSAPAAAAMPSMQQLVQQQQQPVQGMGTAGAALGLQASVHITLHTVAMQQQGAVVQAVEVASIPPAPRPVAPAAGLGVATEIKPEHTGAAGGTGVSFRPAAANDRKVQEPEVIVIDDD
jgi:hypothetical protein